MVVILDFGSQYTQLIARRIREAHVYCEIHPFDIKPEQLARLRPDAIVLSGGPASVYEEGAPHPHPQCLALDVPYLGICYGMGILPGADGAVTTRGSHREYGRADLVVHDDTDLFAGFSSTDATQVWMSHGDKLEQPPAGWDTIAETGSSPYAALRRKDRRRYAIQFHPEVVHTARGRHVLENFLFRVC